MRTQKERQLEELASQLEVPILFRSDIEKHKDTIIMKWTDGKWFIYSVKITPTLNSDNQTISLDSNIMSSIQAAGQLGA